MTGYRSIQKGWVKQIFVCGLSSLKLVLYCAVSVAIVLAGNPIIKQPGGTSSISTPSNCLICGVHREFAVIVLIGVLVNVLVGVLVNVLVGVLVGMTVVAIEDAVSFA